VESGTEAGEHVPATELPAFYSVEYSEEHRSSVGSSRKGFSHVGHPEAVLGNRQQGSVVLSTRSRNDSPQQKENQLSAGRTPNSLLSDFAPARNQPYEPTDNVRPSALSPDVGLSLSELIDTEASFKDAREDHVQTSPWSDFSEQPLFSGLVVPKVNPVIRMPFGSVRHSDEGRMIPVSERAKIEPVVNVTIGRVEVRAVPAHSTVPQRSVEIARPKPMSLDEYLDRRGR
jgi:hypothetical protein